MLDTIEPVLVRYAYGGTILSHDEDEIMFERFLYNGKSMNCNANYDDNITFRNGKMTFCISETNMHCFILVEDKHHQIAFSYIPTLDETYKFKSELSLHWRLGYITCSKSHVVDTAKLTDRFIRLYSKPFKRWRFSHIPDVGMSNDIGYSLRHFIDIENSIKLTR